MHQPPPPLLESLRSPLAEAMQSFRERGGFQGNQRCYQQEPHELSRLENYRHHSQTAQGYEVHSLSAAGMPTAGTSSKDCYGQQPYPSYGSSSGQSKKPYRGGKAPSQQLQAGYSSHINSGYSSQYMSEGHLQQKWDESGQISQYEQDIVGHLEPGASGSSQYLEQNMLAISHSQCHLPSQPSAPVYTSPHQQGHPPNPTASPIMYSQSHIHFPQHSQPPSSTSSSYMEKCNPIPHGYKSGWPPNAQYSRQMGNHTSLKQSGYRPQNNYGYQQPPSRAGFEQASLQGMSGTPESLQKFPHYNQPQQNYCITDISVRSPEQYYQNCSPSSSHSPARSVGRSPSYSSTPSPLMPNPDTFQYGQPINPSSSSVNLQDPNMLMPPHTHPSPSVNHQSQSYSSSMKERFSEKLFSNPSLWSLNALTSQVENISNNVQQLLLSEALMANKKGNKRNQPKKGEEYRGHLKAVEDSSCPDSQHTPLPSDSYSAPRSMPSDLLEVGYSSSTEDQMERNYYYFGQGKGPTNASAQSQLSLDTVSTCSMNSTDDMSVRSGDSDRSIQSAASEDNLSCETRVQKVPFGEEQHSSLRTIRNERSPISITAPSPMKQESNSPIGIKQCENTPKENFEESAWTERINDEKETGKMKLPKELKCKGEVFEATDKRQEWLEEEKCPSFFHKLNKEVSNESYSYETEDNIYQKLKNKYEIEEEDFVGKFCDTTSKGNENSEIKSEMFKSESQNNGDDPITESPAISNDLPEPSLYLPRKEESPETPHFTSECEFSEERLLTSERQNDIFDEQQSALSYSVTEEREKGSLASSEDVINNKAKLEESSTEACNNQGDTTSGPLCVVNTEIAETPAQDIGHRSSERTSVTCDIAHQSHPVRSGFSALNEKTTQNQVRDHIDHSDAKVLEPDSPQLPGKSIISSAPSWADTPPSPQKGDEDVEPGISCPSATKPEPMSPSSHPRLLGRKHARGRRRLIHSNAGMRNVERDGASPSPQKPSMLSINSAIFSDQMEAVQLDIISQTPKLLTEGIPSRMCTRSLGSQNTPKVCSQERRKPGPKSSSKPGPKPGPKPGTKPGLKPSSKPVFKPGPKQGLKPATKPGPKQSPKPGAKPSLRPGPKPNSKTGPKPGAVPSAKPSQKHGLKPAAIPVLKPGPKPGLKPIEGVIPKGPGRPKGLTSRIKSIKYENNIDAITEHIEDTSCMSESPEQQEHTAVSLETVVGTTLHTSIDSTIGSTLDTALDASFVNSVAKDQKSMVLRSRKQTREQLTDVKEKERETSTEARAIKPTELHIQNVSAAQPCENLTSALKSPSPEDIRTDSLSQLNEQIVSVSIKRKSSLQAPDSVKKKKGLKVSQTKTQEPQSHELVVEAQGSKGRRKRGHKLEPSVCRTLTKDNLPLEDINDTPCVPPQCPTKTKYLPPRKGRGLKYEAMVQKITSPASKKQPLNIQPDVVIEELAPKPSQELQVTEKRKAVNITMMTTEKGESTVSIDEIPDTVCIQTPRKKRRKWATVESTDTPDIALETGSLIINTPRLAKQRAIKNNHEMHLKQRKKRRKGTELAKNVPIVETHEQTDVFISPPASPLSSPPTSLFSNTEEKTQGEQLSIEIGSTVIKSKRGRRPSLKKKQEDFSQHIGNEERQKVKKKPGPKKKIQQNNNSTLKVTVKGLKAKVKFKKECVPIVKGILTDCIKTNDSKHSFKPYVHIDRSKKLASLCTIINKPEEEHLLVQIRKKNLEKNKTIPNSSAMLQGPLVNRSLTDRCLICCLCGKPSNYRELGDLCGPYYPENTIPRKTLSLTYHEDFRQNRDREQDKVAMCTSEQINDMKREGEKDLLQEGTSEGDCRQVTRERRAQLKSRLGLQARFKRLQLLQGRAGGGDPPAGEEGSYSVLQRLQLEAEVNEHWAHESCTVWTSGVILIAGKLYGLKEAAQESTLTKCSKCQTEGASISCSWKSCIHKYHYVCAKETGCIFDEENFLIKCPKHQAM
ncbi:retinoic acid-induced protein 1 isoform X3 [Tachysurus fulvidraco]|nr:retinoic acid-induced protein 1 isoform X3 [Tachysurus fulvidraco]XP_047656474.1 retinoic acid-induced protein 1 isoform X3 [Tachysurus fulvidraco]XP_047656475.1 retinoic acid-induced protein 1 isoform X3 [Tachysurus fulvidraco]XP_047656476.1 retinoic acid-induced protein 1 isoform X3 [Tachysurus fulvidraco]